MFAGDVGENCCYEKDNAIFFKRGGKEEKIIDLSDCPLIGEHNYQNVMCAVVVAKLEGISNEKIRNGIMTFVVPEHRLEKFAQKDGIVFYNDSKATNPEAALSCNPFICQAECCFNRRRTQIKIRFKRVCRSC